MKSRRGSLWGTDMGGGDMVSQYAPGDIVKPVAVTDILFTGVVRDVDPRINKVLVAWGGGSMKQHDPDEIMLVPVQDSRMAPVTASIRGRRTRNADFFADRAAAEGGLVPHGDDFVGNPKKHGIGEPRGGGFSIMQDLQKDLHKESGKMAADQDGTGPEGQGPEGKGDGPCKKAAEPKDALDVIANAYKLIVTELPMLRRDRRFQVEVWDPVIRFALEMQKFSHNASMSRRGSRAACPECLAGVAREAGEPLPTWVDPASLPRFTLSDIAHIIYDDHKQQGRHIYFGAKPYLDAMATLKDIKDNYMLDSGSSIVAYLLSNLTSWKGDTARAVKKELNRRLK